MILIDRKDVDRLIPLGLPKSCFYPDREIEGHPDEISPGPFIAIVTEDRAWVGTRVGNLYGVAPKRADAINYRIWAGLADLYVAEMGISRQSFVKRFSAMTRFLSRNRESWFPWEQVYHWPEGSDLAWSSALMGSSSSFLKAREHNGQRQVRYNS
jgi:hypothetical protein